MNNSVKLTGMAMAAVIAGSLPFIAPEKETPSPPSVVAEYSPIQTVADEPRPIPQYSPSMPVPDDAPAKVEEEPVKVEPLKTEEDDKLDAKVAPEVEESTAEPTEETEAKTTTGPYLPQPRAQTEDEQKAQAAPIKKKRVVKRVTVRHNKFKARRRVRPQVDYCLLPFCPFRRLFSIF